MDTLMDTGHTAYLRLPHWSVLANLGIHEDDLLVKSIVARLENHADYVIRVGRAHLQDEQKNDPAEYLERR